MRIIYMGTPEFAVPALNSIIDAGHDVELVVTQPDRRGNRGKVVFSPVKDTRAFLTSATSTSSTKEDQDPQFGQRPRYLGELYPQF